MYSNTMFCDEVKITVVAGQGGNGCASFRREKFIAKGGPDGGDGGRGGNVIIQVDTNLNTLSNLAHQKIFSAESGKHGMGKKMYGRKGEDLIIKVPKGTLVLEGEKKELIVDLDKHDSAIVIAKGGKGGLGNTHFVSSTHQAPKFAEDGEPGEKKEIILELKLVADVGIIGLPSAGKSTLISVISNSKPKIANYPFTTLIPNLGVVDMQKFGGGANDSFVVADIPGLIEGASEGKGLGHKFLKHVSRTKILIHLIDAYLENPAENYKTIRKELKAFDKTLIKNEEIIVLNKIDLIDEVQLKKVIKDLKKATKANKVICISAVTKKNLSELLFEVVSKLKNVNKLKPKVTKKSETAIIKPREYQSFKIEKIIRKKDHKTFRIIGEKIERLVVMTNIHNPEGLERIYQHLEKMGIKKEIDKKGATYGDTIRIKEKNIPYRK